MSPARAIPALAHEHFPVITQGASEPGIILIIEDQDSERALRCLHRDLIAPVIPLVRHEARERKREARSEHLNDAYTITYPSRGFLRNRHGQTNSHLTPSES